MKKTVTFIICVVCAISLYAQNDNYSIVHIYRKNDLFSQNKIGKLFINDLLKIGLKGGSFDTLHVKPGCYNLRTNKNKDKISKCLESNKDYYFKIVYKYIFLFGKFELIEVTKDFALAELKELERKSLKK